VTPTAVRRGLERLARCWLAVALLGGFVLIWPQTFGGQVAYIKVDGHSMDPTFHLDDLVVVRQQQHYQVGDAVVYRIPAGEFGAGSRVIHRLKQRRPDGTYITQGDNKPLVDPWHPTDSDVVGKAWFDVPAGGRYFASLAKPMPLGLLCAGLTVFAMLLPDRKRQRTA